MTHIKQVASQPYRYPTLWNRPNIRESHSKSLRKAVMTWNSWMSPWKGHALKRDDCNESISHCCDSAASLLKSLSHSVLSFCSSSAFDFSPMELSRTGLLLLLHGVSVIWAYPSGAPTGACEDMIPRHLGVQPQPTRAPYSVLVNGKTFLPGCPVTGQSTRFKLYLCVGHMIYFNFKNVILLQS